VTGLPNPARAVPPDGRERVQVYLSAGQIFASAEPCEITTILGSCVGVLLIDSFRRSGGASHYLLPFDSRGSGVASARFGDTAISQLLDRMLSLGSRRGDLVAKVFGGASTLAPLRAEAQTLGSKNVDVARRRLEEESIPIVAEDVGGHSGRKVVLLTDVGHVWVKKL
jgi:chemotaxis protein CheD